MKPLILLKDKLYPLVWFWNVEIPISINPAAKNDRKFYRTIRNLIWIRSPLTCWRFLKAACSIFEFYPLLSNQMAYICFQIWSGGPCQKDTSSQCLWRQSEISALITEFNSFLLVCDVKMHSVSITRSALYGLLCRLRSVLSLRSLERRKEHILDWGHATASGPGGKEQPVTPRRNLGQNQNIFWQQTISQTRACPDYERKAGPADLSCMSEGQRKIRRLRQRLATLFTVRVNSC